jgi:hypothetical protein
VNPVRNTNNSQENKISNGVKLLLHTCCAPCLIYPLRILKEKGFEVTAFFYNPNIHPFAEYKRRCEAVSALSQNIKIEVIYQNYDIENFFRRIAFKEKKDERCPLCWQMRLEETARFARLNRFVTFSTTLLISPYQKHDLLKQIGEDIANKEDIEFYYQDFRTGFRESQSQAHKQSIYCQKYCGCIFSERERLEKI